MTMVNLLRNHKGWLNHMIMPMPPTWMQDSGSNSSNWLVAIFPLWLSLTARPLHLRRPPPHLRRARTRASQKEKANERARTRMSSATLQLVASLPTLRDELRPLHAFAAVSQDIGQRNALTQLAPAHRPTRDLLLDLLKAWQCRPNRPWCCFKMNMEKNDLTPLCWTQEPRPFSVATARSSAMWTASARSAIRSAPSGLLAAIASSTSVVTLPLRLDS